MNNQPAQAVFPRCIHLRTKAMYVPGIAARAFHVDEPAPICWCNRTLGDLGPDREPADIAPCSDPRRPCYKGTAGSAPA